MKNRIWVTRTLAAVLVLVWGSIGYQLIAVISSADPSSDGSIGKSATPTSFQPYEYRADVRDPFTVPISVSRLDTAFRHRSRIPAIVPPALKLTGIMAEGDRKMALIEEPGGTLRFVRQGDTIGGLRVLKIEHKIVRYRFQNRQMAWRLEDDSVRTGTH